MRRGTTSAAARTSPAEPGLVSKAARPYLLLLCGLAILVVAGVVFWSARAGPGRDSHRLKPA